MTDSDEQINNITTKITNPDLATPYDLLPLLLSTSQFTRGVAFAAQLGVSSVSWRVILLLEAHGPMRPSEISESEHTSRATTSAVLKRLECENIIIRLPDTQDKRGHVITLSTHGHRSIIRWKSQVKNLLQELATSLTPTEIKTLETAQKIIEKFNNTLERKFA